MFSEVNPKPCLKIQREKFKRSSFRKRQPKFFSPWAMAMICKVVSRERQRGQELGKPRMMPDKNDFVGDG